MEKTTVSKKSNSNNKKNESMPNSVFHEFFVDELKDIYWAEKHLVTALPKMIKGATTQELKDAITEHLEETKNQVSRLEEVFESIGEKATAKKCDAMEGLLEEGKSILEDTEKDSMVRDAGIILASQKIEHYEIATYGTLVAFARKMGHDEAVHLLEVTLAEEKGADDKLTNIALDHINEEAVQE